jgi:TPR repeat protein
MDEKMLEELDRLKEKADEGDERAMHDYAMLIVNDEPQVAFRYMKMAAELEDPRAMNDLGVYYATGVGCIEDRDMGVSYFKKAAEYGDANGQRNYALAVEDSDPKLAYRYMIMAANQKNRDAMNDLGLYYKHGMGTNVNKDKAIEWTKKAADLGDDNGSRNYANLVYDIRPEEAFKYMFFAANKGNIDAKYDLAQFYKNGIGISPCEDKYLELLKEAALEGDMIAQKEYALLKVGEDPINAFKFMQEAAFKGDIEAMVYLADFYYQGTGKEENKEAAKQWYREAADLGNAYASRCYGELILDEDENDAMYYLEYARDHGDDEAQSILEKLKRK